MTLVFLKIQFNDHLQHIPFSRWLLRRFFPPPSPVLSFLLFFCSHLESFSISSIVFSPQIVAPRALSFPVTLLLLLRPFAIRFIYIQILNATLFITLQWKNGNSLMKLKLFYSISSVTLIGRCQSYLNNK